MADLADYEKLPGLRDYSGKETSQQGVEEILDVVAQLTAAEIPSCVIGVKALRYFGAARVTNARESNRISVSCCLTR
jgi:hypothetical protein